MAKWLQTSRNQMAGSDRLKWARLLFTWGAAWCGRAECNGPIEPVALQRSVADAVGHRDVEVQRT
jgi:hypothetical protein